MQTNAAWEATSQAITRNDAHTRGILILGLGESEAALAHSFAAAARHPLVRGFAVGRTIFTEPAAAYMLGEMTPDAAVSAMQQAFARLCHLWDAARADIKG
jgi:5-dehydro-2-deoxygluconokinase